MHNGSQATLRQVISFYSRGGDFHEANIADLSPDMHDGAADTNGNVRLDSCERQFGDLNLDGRMGGIDLAMLMTVWGERDPPYGDLDGDRWVGSHDLAFLMSRWGPVP